MPKKPSNSTETNLDTVHVMSATGRTTTVEPTMTTTSVAPITTINTNNRTTPVNVIKVAMKDGLLKLVVKKGAKRPLVLVVTGTRGEPAPWQTDNKEKEGKGIQSEKSKTKSKKIPKTKAMEVTSGKSKTKQMDLKRKHTDPKSRPLVVADPTDTRLTQFSEASSPTNSPVSRATPESAHRVPEIKEPVTSKYPPDLPASRKTMGYKVLKDSYVQKQVMQPKITSAPSKTVPAIVSKTHPTLVTKAQKVEPLAYIDAFAANTKQTKSAPVVKKATSKVTGSGEDGALANLKNSKVPGSGEGGTLANLNTAESPAGQQAEDPEKRVTIDSEQKFAHEKHAFWNKRRILIASALCCILVVASILISVLIWTFMSPKPADISSVGTSFPQTGADATTAS